MGVKQALFRATPYLMGMGFALLTVGVYIALISVSADGVPEWLIKALFGAGVFLLVLTLVPCSGDETPP